MKALSNKAGDTQMASIRKEILIDARPENVWAPSAIGGHCMSVWCLAS
jgi:hypothetical protein